MRESAGLGIDIGFDILVLVHGQRGLDKQKFAFRAGLEINALRFIILRVRAICCREAFAKENDKGIVGI